MTEHLSSLTLSALADGELSAGQLSVVKEHLDTCPYCTSAALTETLLKTATAKAEQSYTAGNEFQNRMKNLVAQEKAKIANHKREAVHDHSYAPRPWIAFSGWAVAALLCAAIGVWFVQRQDTAQTAVSLVQQASLATEISDQHVAMLAANQPLQVLSSDRHTVKPWFQGKIPFAFNLPEQLPPGMTLLGADLAYLHNQPVAQLVYGVGQHRVSVFVCAKYNGGNAPNLSTETLPPQHAGFQIAGFTTENFSGIAISDVDRPRLIRLVNAIPQAQR